MPHGKAIELIAAVGGGGAAGVGIAMVQNPPLTLWDLAGPAAFIVGILMSLLGAIWSLHQQEIKALRASIDKIDTRTGSIQTSIQNLTVQLAGNYATRADLAQVREELREEIRGR